MSRLSKFFKIISRPKRKMRFTITFSEKGFARLKVLMNLDESKDVSVFLLRALGWYGATVECIASGGTVTMEKPQESEEIMRSYEDVIEWLNRNGIN